MKKLTEQAVTIQGTAFTAAHMMQKGSGVVSLHGAIHAGDWHAPLRKEPVADVVASSLDEGTAHHSRNAFRYAIEREGARVDFWSEGRYLYFSVVGTVSGFEPALSLAFEALSEPLLAEEAVRQVIEREAAEFMHASENTRSESARAMTRLLFSEGSAGYAVSNAVEKERTLALKREDVLSFFKETYRGRIILSATGDIEASRLESLLNAHTAKWNATPAGSARAVQALPSNAEPKKLFVPIPGKESVDVHMGAALPITPQDPSFPAVRMALDLLGGGFSDHLTQTVRDRDGLTYGTYARIAGVRNGAALSWSAWAMFGNSLFDKGLAALQREIGVFKKEGITEARVKEKLGEIEGRYAVVFSDMRGVVNELMTGLLATGSPHAVDEYISHLHELSAKDVQLASDRYLRVDAVSAAGAIDEKGNLL